MKKFLIFVFLILSFHASVFASKSNDFDQIYEEQFKASGAQSLMDSVPKESAKSIRRMGIESANWGEILKFSPEKIFKEILNILKDKAAHPTACIMPALAVMLLGAVISGLKTSFGSNHIAKIMSSISTLCLCAVLITPIVKCINSAAVVIKSAAGFTLCAVPVMASIMVAYGRVISATSYQTLVLGAGQVISHFAGDFLIPCMNMLLGISVISSISPRLNLDGLCSAIYKSAKFVLKLVASLFTGVLTIQNLVTSSADSLGTDTAKLAIDSCIPIVGGAISDAFSTVQGCIKLLKSGVGAFGIIAGTAIFFPVIIECSLWILFLSLGAGLGDVFKLKKVSSLFKCIENVMTVVLASVLCSMMILTVSSVVLLIVGR